jgi:hypothetical protein
LFKNNFIVLRNRSQFTAETQRTQRRRRDKRREEEDKGREGQERPLNSSPRDLSVLCVSAVNWDYHVE